MVAHVTTVAFQGIEAVPVDVQVQISPGKAAFILVGLPDKAVAESRERIQAALHASGLALPPKRITVNLAPADLPKEGSHYDLPIALGVMVAMGALPADLVAGQVVLGELSLDGGLAAVAGVLPAAIAANGLNCGLICPSACGAEAAWAGDGLSILAPSSLISFVNHGAGHQVLAQPEPSKLSASEGLPDLADIRGQETARRALEVAAAGGHNLLLIGPPGAGKSMLAGRLPSILPPLTPRGLLEVSMIASIAGKLTSDPISTLRPFRAPHHSASMAAMVGGGMKAFPGEVSLAHQGVLFLDEIPEFSPGVLDSLRQPLETGEASIARANHHVTYPSRFQMIAAMNPCRCGGGDDAMSHCRRGVRCRQDYFSRISGPLMDRIDIRLEVPAVKASDLIGRRPSEPSADVRDRVSQARERQSERYGRLDRSKDETNATVDANVIETIAVPENSGQTLLKEAAESMRLSARGYFRVLRLARTLADLDASEQVKIRHIAEALSYRNVAVGQAALS